MGGLSDFETNMLMQSKPLARADNKAYEWPWQVAARYNRETEQLNREANSDNKISASVARKQLLRVRKGGDKSYFTGC